MKSYKLSVIALAIGTLIASSAMAQTASGTRNTSPRVSSRATVRTGTNQWAGNRNHRWGHRNHDWRHRHHRHRSNVFFGIGLGYPYYGYPYYGSYPYGYYARPRTVVYEGVPVAGGSSVVVEVQRRLARAGYYHGSVDGVIGAGTRRAIRSYERTHGLPVDGRIDQRFLVTLGIA